MISEKVMQSTTGLSSEEEEFYSAMHRMSLKEWKSSKSIRGFIACLYR